MLPSNLGRSRLIQKYVLIRLGSKSLYSAGTKVLYFQNHGPSSFVYSTKSWWSEGFAVGKTKSLSTIEYRRHEEDKARKTKTTAKSWLEACCSITRTPIRRDRVISARDHGTQLHLPPCVTNLGFSASISYIGHRNQKKWGPQHVGFYVLFHYHTVLHSIHR